MFKRKSSSSPKDGTSQEVLRKYSTAQYLNMTVRLAKLTVLSFWHKHKLVSRLIIAFVAVVFLFFLYNKLFDKQALVEAYKIPDNAQSLVGEPIELYASKLIKEDNGTLSYNKNYATSNEVLGVSLAPKFGASFMADPKEGISVSDPQTGTAVSFVPQYELRTPKKDQNRVVYPLLDQPAIKVYTLKGTGVKEDIIFKTMPEEDAMTFSYEVKIPEGAELRLESDNSISVYGVDTSLLGDVVTGTEEDKALLEKARENAPKTNLLFRIPKPVVLEPGLKQSSAKAHFTVEGSMLHLHVEGLMSANYPLSVDPTIYVETARKLMRGNNETNIDFDIENELIKKGFTTGARFDEWSDTMNLNDGRWDMGTAVAGGNIYAVGGQKSDSVVTTYSTAGSDTFVVPAGVTEINVKLWGAGGGGGAGGGSGGFGVGGSGGGGGFAETTLSVTPSESLNIFVGEAGAGGTYPGTSGSGGGGGGHSEINRSGTNLVIAAGGGGGGGGDNSSSTPGGGGGAGGGTSGQNGSSSSSAGGGNAGGTSCGGSLCDGGTGGDENGASGGFESGGNGGSSATGGTGGGGAGGVNDGGDGGLADTGGFAGGGGGGGGYYGGGGGSASASGNAGGGGGGGGSSYSNGSSTTLTTGSGPTPGNNADSQRNGAGQGGAGGSAEGSGSNGSDGIVIIEYSVGAGSGPRSDVYWAQLSTTDNSIESPNPGPGVCTEWCTDSSYDLPEARAGFSLVAYNGYLYAIGGIDGSYNREATVFISKIGINGEPSLWHPTDTNPNNWVYWYESSNTLPVATSYASAVAYNNVLYFSGGQTDASPGGVSSVYAAPLNPTGDIGSWTSTGIASLSSVRHMHDMQVYNDRLYIIGGNSNGSLQDTVYYSKINTNGTINAWTQTSSFSTARSTWGGNYSVIWGGYMYLMGGCSAVNGSGNCTNIEDDIQLASINADGTLGTFNQILGLTNQRMGYGLKAWDNALYRIGGCNVHNAVSGECDGLISDEDYAVINTDGEASTVANSVPSGNAPCTGGSPTSCDLPGTVGNMLNATVLMNGYLYVMGGCTNNPCSSYSSGIVYQAVSSDGTLQRPDACNGSYSGSYCLSSVSLPTAIGAPGVTTFDGRIYLVGGFPTVTNINYVSVNPDGSLGGWSSTDFTDIAVNGIDDDLSYTFAYTRANPNNAGSVPGNLYIFGGCTGTTSGVGCSSYSSSVYKCDIATSGAPSNCTTTGQLQIGTVTGNDGNPTAGGLGAHAGAVYANYIYLLGGLSASDGGSGNGTDLTFVRYARFDDNNNVVAVSGSDWIEGPNEMVKGRRRGTGFGYNGYLYVLGGYDGADAIADIEFAKINVSDGSWGAFNQSSVSIQKRWGLTSAVSNSYAYVVGGCIAGAAPSSCSSRTDSIQTFQIYNNDSGAPAGYTDGANLFANDRFGASSAVVNGHIYVAGGCISTSLDCDSTTDDVQFAALDEYGNIGAWSSTTAPLPESLAWGQLEHIDGTLYYIGGNGVDVCSPTGDAYFEKYDGISGTAVADLYADPDYPNNPSSTQTISSGSLQSSANIDDNFGGRLSALVCAPEDGDYVFWISGDDGSELLLSTDTNPANTSSIATVPGWSGVNEWDKYAEQESAPVTLEAGKYYYIEANYKEGTGGDHVQIGWTLPSATNERPIPDTRYSMPTETDAVSIDASSEVYYANPSSGGLAGDTVRTTTYKLASGQFTGTTYTLSLNDNLENDYFVMISGGDNRNGTSSADTSQVRVDGDPFGNFPTTTSSDEIRLTRGNSGFDWNSTVTVVECVNNCATNGFTLSEVINGESGEDGNLPNGDTSVDYTLASAHTSNTVPFGGYLGGGLSTTASASNNFASTAGVRVRKNSTNQIRVERDATVDARVVDDADITIYVVNWGSAWNVQEVNVDNWNAGNAGSDAVGEYHQASISSVTGENTWVWKSPGTSEDDGLGDGAFGKIVTLGDGVADPTGTVSQISLGSRYSSSEDIRDDTVYVMEHPDLAVDYRFHTESSAISFTETVDSSIQTESYTSGSVSTSEGYRIPLFYYSSTGTGTAYTRVAGYSHYYTDATTVSIARNYSGQDNAGWLQSVDFGNMASGTSTQGDVLSWQTASNGLPNDRTQISAAVWNDRIYVTGGIDDTGADSNSVYISPQLTNGGDITSSWTSDADVFDVPRSGHTTVAYANNLYVLGGYDGANYLNDVQFTQINADGTIDPWTFTTSMPESIRQGDGFVANGYLYVIGGRNDDFRCESSTLVTSISANTTVATGNNPTGISEWYETNQRYDGERYGNSVVYNDGKAYVTGGVCFESSTTSQVLYDDFDPSIDGSQWTSTGSAVADNYCDANSGDALHFEGSTRTASTVDVDVTYGGTISFYLFSSSNNGGGCNSPEAGEDLIFEYSTNNGGSWDVIATYAPDVDPMIYVTENIPAGAMTNDTRFRFTQPSSNGGANDQWVIDELEIQANNAPSMAYTGADRVQQTSLLAQPQKAIYSRLIDTDTDVFPNSWLLNGIDNSIGARWEVSYRSMNDPDGIVDDCGPADMSTWGEITNFGEATLGDIAPYYALNGNGTDINCARYFYFKISIDSTHTFGYPEDVQRGPTIADLSLFFTSDPNKRLRHGKTFTGGEQQPLDTPCRQSVDSDCPLP